MYLLVKEKLHVDCPFHETVRTKELIKEMRKMNVYFEKYY